MVTTLNSSSYILSQGFQQGFNISGCTDPLACNYDSTANVDDGSCVYPGCVDPSIETINSGLAPVMMACIFHCANLRHSTSVGDSMEIHRNSRLSSC